MNDINNAMDQIRARISSPRNTVGWGSSSRSAFLARYQSAAFVVAHTIPTPMWSSRRHLRALPANDPIAVS